MSKPVKFFTRSNFKPETGDFEVIFESPDGGKISVMLPPKQYIDFVAYHATVVKSYIEWMKQGGK